MGMGLFSSGDELRLSRNAQISLSCDAANVVCGRWFISCGLFRAGRFASGRTAIRIFGWSWWLHVIHWRLCGLWGHVVTLAHHETSRSSILSHRRGVCVGVLLLRKTCGLKYLQYTSECIFTLDVVLALDSCAMRGFLMPSSLARVNLLDYRWTQ